MLLLLLVLLLHLWVGEQRGESIVLEKRRVDIPEVVALHVVAVVVSAAAAVDVPETESFASCEQGALLLSVY